MVEVAQLTRPKIRRQVGDASLLKARSFLHKHVWTDLRLQGPTIKGRCRGQLPQPYRVEVTFDGDAIEAAHCMCPTGDGGHCKHVAALLLYYREHPDAFIEMDELEPALERRGKGELIALIRHMIRRVPELELLLEAPLPGYADGQAVDDPEPFRRQAAAAFDRGGTGDDAAACIANELADVVATGAEFRASGNVSGAAAVYRGVVAVMYDRLFSVEDEDGKLLAVIGACASGLCACLEQLPPGNPNRDDLLRALVDVLFSDEAFGGLGGSDIVPDVLLHRTAPDERRRVARWIRERLPQGDSWSDEYLRRELGSILLDLEADDLNDEAYLRLCKETGRIHELVDRLLTLGRVKEALKIVKTADEDELPTLADLLVQHAHTQDAEWLIEDRAAKSAQAQTLFEWLKRRAVERHDRVAAVRWAEKLFQLQRTLQGYEELRRLTSADDWPVRREQLLAQLEKEKAAWLVLEISLREHDVASALRIANTPSGRQAPNRLDVARAAEKDYPQQALALYREASEELIDQRDRESYRTACGYLRKVRDLSQQLGASPTWKAYVAGLRAKHRTLRAFREELDRVKL